MTPRMAVLRACAWVACASSAVAFADGDARALVRRGAEQYERGELDAAIATLEEANRIEVTAEGCYVLGQVLRKQGDCVRAIQSYRCAVERAPDEAFARAANYQIGRCVIESGLGAPPPETTVVASPVDVPRQTEAPPPVARERWYRDTAGGLLVGLGLGAAGVGTGLLVHAELRAGRAGEDLAGFRAADGVGTERVTGAVALSVGSALVLGGIVRYVLVGRR